jgi:glycosyltransferase involved in cell wall biosynthesis
MHMLTTVVSSRATAARSRATVRSAPGAVVVLDLDGTYRPVGEELVLSPDDLGLASRHVSAQRVLLGAEALEHWAHPYLLRHALSTEPVALAVRPGVLLRPAIVDALDGVHQHGVALVARGGPVDDGLWPAPADLLDSGSFLPALIGVSRDALAFVDDWQQLPAGGADRWLDVLASRHPHHVVPDGVVVSAWSTTVDVASAAAVDLSRLDGSAPWLLDPRATTTPRVRLSEHPALAATVAVFVDETGTDDPPAAVSSVGIPVEPHLVSLVGAAVAAGVPFDGIPDAFDADAVDALASWLDEPVAAAGGLGRYLAEVYGARADLRAAFPNPSGADGPALREWARSVGPADLATAPVPAAASRSTHRAEGVNVVGYLSGELGIGESARLMLSAIEAAHVPHATVPVTKHLRSRQTAAYRAAASDTLFDVSLLCVNAKETPSIVASVAPVVKGTYRIGMWYWETEVFPPNQHKGFKHVDEVWVATDFVRAAIEPHSPVPVHTVTPPLPQPNGDVDPAAARSRLGLPDRPILLFSFDYASIAERKNPWGLVDAFEAAFDSGEGPLLVIKSISGDRNPAQAERLRLRVSGSSDIVLIEDYLDADDRDALMASCDCYVSLHRAEGLGLTMAEAMALGKPVIATAYGGNMQFMTDENSFLVPSTPIAVPAGSGPYTAGTVWADPDLEVAAQAMRTVFDDLAAASARGRRAAADLRALHSPEVAGRAVAARLDEIRARQVPEPAPTGFGTRLRSAARRRLDR